MTSHLQGRLEHYPAPYAGTRWRVGCSCGKFVPVGHTEPAGALIAWAAHFNRSESK